MSPMHWVLNASLPFTPKEVRKATESKEKNSMSIKGKAFAWDVESCSETLSNMEKLLGSSPSEWESMYSKQRMSPDRMLKYAYVSLCSLALFLNEKSLCAFTYRHVCFGFSPMLMKMSEEKEKAFPGVAVALVTISPTTWMSQLIDIDGVDQSKRENNQWWCSWKCCAMTANLCLSGFPPSLIYNHLRTIASMTAKERKCLSNPFQSTSIHAWIHCVSLPFSVCVCVLDTVHSKRSDNKKSKQKKASL